MRLCLSAAGAPATGCGPKPAQCAVTRLTLLSEQAPGPVVMDLTGDLAALKDQVFVLKEGVDYRGKITFKVHREITVYMGYEFVTPVEEAPRGAPVRGPYLVLSLFTEDNRTRHLSWEWGLRVCQDWKE
ncbi:hypothetical protein P7K49_013091 [Saguinus oedipus]|uniref:Uncharacterized protein n=1 Tax=Saguinus oedipus TaxID=9490 RepID=A0ABQ9VF74_SAGOE|nr:hypothetical protein P7K49_013091 [Saguinus oedipus]